MANTAIATSEAVAPAKLHKGKGSPLTLEQLNAMVVLARLERTQAQIAEAVGCDQATVCRYLQSLAPTGDYAGAFLRAKQAELAEKFIVKAKGSDILDILERFESIPAKKDAGKASVVVQIGIKDSDVQVTLSPPASQALGEGQQNR